MAKDKKKKEDEPKPVQVATQGESGSDPRGRGQNQNAYQQDRFESQIDPYIDESMGNYGQASDQAFEDYGGIMDQYRDLGGPEGYGEFAKTGGFSEADKANIRARGISPIRAAYSNAEREVERNRSLQGGYSPNATATLAKMAREQGQASADAATNVEAELAGKVQQGRLAGLAGQLGTIQGQTGLYGTSPGMASTFGNQALGAIGQSGNFGLGTTRNEIDAQRLPGAFDNTINKINAIGGAATPWIDDIANLFKKTPAVNQNPQSNPNPQFGGTTGQPGASPTPPPPAPSPVGGSSSNWSINPGQGMEGGSTNPFGDRASIFSGSQGPIGVSTQDIFAPPAKKKPSLFGGNIDPVFGGGR